MPVLDKAQPSTKLRREAKVKALLVGPSKSGKTTSACTILAAMPESERALLVDIDLRASSVYGTPRLDVIQILEPDPMAPKAWTELKQLKSELWMLARKNEFPYGAIIFDGLTKINTIAMNYVLTLRTTKGDMVSRGLADSPAQPHYAPQMQELSRLVNSLIPLPCHIIFTGHLDLYKDDVLGTFQYFPRVYGKTRTEIGSWFDETYLCERASKGGGKMEHRWVTDGTTRNDFLGSSLNKRHKLWKSPLVLDLDKPKPGFAHILDLVKESKDASDTSNPRNPTSSTSVSSPGGSGKSPTNP